MMWNATGDNGNSQTSSETSGDEILEKESTELNIELFVGIVIGALAVIALIVVFILLFLRLQSRKKYSCQIELEEQENVHPTGLDWDVGEPRVIPWVDGSRSEAEKILKAAPSPSFVIRPASQDPTSYVCSLWNGTKFLHALLTLQSDSTYALEGYDDLRFASLSDFIRSPFLEGYFPAVEELVTMKHLLRLEANRS